MADMQGGILLSSDLNGFFHSLEVDIDILYRLLGPVHHRQMAGHLVKVGPTGVYFDVKRKDPLAHDDTIDVHLHIPSLLGVSQGPGRLLTVAKVLSCSPLGKEADRYGCRSYRILARFCQRPRWLG